MTCAISSELNSPPSRFFSINDGKCIVDREWWSVGVVEFNAIASVHYSITPLPRLLQSDRMPRGFHFDGIENPIRVFPVPIEVICDGALNVTLDVDGGAGLQFLTDLV